MFPHSYGKFGPLGDDEHEPRLAAPPIHEREEGATRRPIRPRPIWRGSPDIQNQRPRASTVGGPGKKGDRVTKAVFLEKLQHGMPSSRGPTSVASMWSSDAFHGHSSRSGLSTPGLLLHLLHQCVDGVGLPAAPGRRCRRGAPGIGQVTPRQTIRQHRCEAEA